jgi:HSP20 family protein
MVYRSTLAAPVFGLRREIDRLFEDTFGRDSGRMGWNPAVDVREDSKELALEVELPGIAPSDVEVTAENGVLTIRGEKRGATKEDSGETRYHMIERSYGTFLRSFQLPQGVDDQRIEAEFTNGLLVVHIPKAALPQPRRIEIRDSGSQPTVQGTTSRSIGRSGSESGAGAGSQQNAQAPQSQPSRGKTSGSGQNTSENAGTARASGEAPASRTNSRSTR